MSVPSRPVTGLPIATTACLILTCLALSSNGSRGDAAATWEDRLEALRPAVPMAYFELAEEVADRAEDEAQRGLARHLFALAGVLDRDRLGRSACLALADLAEREHERRRLIALASLLGRGGIGRSSTSFEGLGLDGDPTPTAMLALSEAFSYFRRGRGSQALAALREPGAMELLEACDPYLPGGANRFLEECRSFRGRVRPNLSQADEIRMLRLETALLAGSDRPWSSALLYGEGRPLIEVDPARLEETLGVDASRPLYRNGRWVEADP
ncbi:MAG: hypothetical protein SYC29_03825 [Planctomycetota bacterium]|nr:hypothetical protein [Planctomycetota bacterium]